MKLTENCQAFLICFREKGLVDAILAAKDVAEEIDIEPVFPIKRSRRKKKFSYEGPNEVTGSSEEVFKRDVFFPLVDSVMTSLRERMEQLQKHHSLWGFLYNMNKLPEKEELKKRCIHLQDFLTVGNISEINGKDLCCEISHYDTCVVYHS